MPRTILVVDDDHDIRSLLEETLEDEGYAAVCAKDGDEALLFLADQQPDAAIVDILLPTMDGFELVEAIRAQEGGEKLPIVFITGIYKSARHIRRAKEELGAVGFLEKPLRLDKVLRALKAGWRRPKRSKEVERTVVDKVSRFADPTQRAEKEEVERTQQAFEKHLKKGDLADTPIAELLSGFYRARANGALLVKTEDIKKIIYFKDGYPVFVKSNLLSECLGQILVKERILSDVECDESLDLMKKTGRQQGTVLVEMGAISPYNLVYGLQLQLQRKLLDVFGWEGGRYAFNRDLTLTGESVQLDLSLATIIYQGIRDHVADAKVNAWLDPHWEHFLTPHPNPLHRFQEISLEPRERKLLALVDGKRRTREVIQMSGLPPRRAAKLAHALIASEMVECRESPAGELAAPGSGAPVGSEPRRGPPPLPRGKKGSGGPPPRKGARAQSSPGGRLADATVDEIRERLTKWAGSLRRSNHFEVLGLSREADADEVRRAYLALRLDLHPDQLRSNAPADARALAEQIQQHLTTAYETLHDARRRTAYEDDMEERAARGAGDPLADILAAEAAFKKGQDALLSESVDQAVAHFREAISLYPEEGEFFIHLGWALHQANVNDEATRGRAEEQIKKGLKLSPRCDLGYVYLGRLLTLDGRKSEAQRQFENAIRCNPECTEALAELSLGA
jgi:DNA-binding response OmpR family regulator